MWCPKTSELYPERFPSEGIERIELHPPHATFTSKTKQMNENLCVAIKSIDESPLFCGSEWQ